MWIPMWLCVPILSLFCGMFMYILFDLKGWTIKIWGIEDEDN